MFLQLVINSLAIGSLYALTAMGATLIYGILGILDIANAGAYLIGAYIGYYIYVSTGQLVLAFLGAMLAVGLLGVVLHRTVYGPILAKPRMLSIIPLVAAVGLSGKEGGGLPAVQTDPARGRVGSITRVEPRILQTLLDGDFLPVVSPIAAGEDGGGFNCNADDAARAVAAALGADKLIFLTDTAGVLIDSHNSKTAVPHMDVKRAEELIDTGLIAGGMVRGDSLRDLCVLAGRFV